MNKEINYALGLDIGITSVGWSVINLDINRIEDLGVRIFNAAENPKDGASLALPRRAARGRRRLTRRKAYRINRVKKLIVSENILTESELNPKDGASLALPRRAARGRRRLTRRKAYRINRVKKLIVSENILTESELNNIFTNKDIISVWEARVQGLDRMLSNEEWAKILINLCKRRGFKSNRKNEAKDKEMGQILTSIEINAEKMEETKSRTIGELINLCKRRGFKSNRKNEAKDKEMGQILTSIEINAEKMEETKSRTIGELIYKETISEEDKYKAFRNKSGEYNRCVSRDMIRNEIHTLFEQQRKFGNKNASDDVEDKYLEIFNSQRPYSNFEELEKLVGWCTFEKKKYKRAPKNCISAEEFVLYESINKLSIICNGEKRKLNNEERDLIVNEAFNKKEIKYSGLRKLLSLNDEERFSTLTYSIDKDMSKTENTKFISLKGYHEIKKAIEHGVNKEYWKNIKGNKKMLNDIAYVLTLGKTDEEIENQLRLRDIPSEIIEAVSDMSFSKFNNLSIEAIDKILPFMKEGYQYNEACEKAGYDFKAIYKGEKCKKLPVIEIDEIVNPVVIRSLAQTRKVINAVIDRYGSPIRINIELARELSKNFKDRKAIEKEQKENRDNIDKIKKQLVIDRYGSPIRINIELARELSKNFKDRKAIEKEQKENRDNIDKIKKQLEELMGKVPTGREVLKYRLWQQQRGECAYTQQSIYIEKLFEAGYCEIDHIIPFSRCFDDSLSNKVLVMGVENQRKGNRTPYEYFGSDIERWNKYEIWVKGSHLNYKKKNNLLKKKLSQEEQKEWKSRNLNDTKYICRYISNFVNSRLEFKESESKQKVITINGRATAYLRAVWGLSKVREDGDKHHALDATIVAVATQGMVQKISHYSKANELKYIRKYDDYIDVETGEIVNLEEYEAERNGILPRPWQGFSQELMLRLSDDPKEELKKTPINSYDMDFISNSLRPIFVSRVPFRKIGGKLFKETVYSKKDFKEGYFVSKKKLSDLKEKDLDNLYNYECDKRLYDAIIERMKVFNYDGKKAFVEEFRKPTKNGELGPVVRSIKVKTTVPFKDGIEVNEGLSAKEKPYILRKILKKVILLVRKS